MFVTFRLPRNITRMLLMNQVETIIQVGTPVLSECSITAGDTMTKQYPYLFMAHV